MRLITVASQTARVVFWAMLLGLMTGCAGGARPEPISDTAKPLAQALQTATKAKDAAKINEITIKAQQFFDNNRLNMTELSVFKGVQNFAQKGNWDKAQDLIDRSLAIR